MKNQTITVAAIALILGLVGGYILHSSIASRPTQVLSGKHMMPNGSTMSNASMDKMMEDMIIGLVGKTGATFDKIFIDEMIIHHQGAVDMAKLVLTSTTRPELIQLATNIIASQTLEINMMRQWQVEWFE